MDAVLDSRRRNLQSSGLFIFAGQWRFELFGERHCDLHVGSVLFVRFLGEKVGRYDDCCKMSGCGVGKK